MNILIPDICLLSYFTIIVVSVLSPLILETRTFNAHFVHMYGDKIIPCDNPGISIVTNNF